MSVVRIRERLPRFPVAKHERDRLQNGYERGKHPSGNPLHVKSQRRSMSRSRARGPTGWSTDFYSVLCGFESCRARQNNNAHPSLFNAGLGHRLITWPPTRQSRFESRSPPFEAPFVYRQGSLFFKQKRRVQFSQGVPLGGFVQWHDGAF